ncbi:unnamed protein product, partial [Iphiclides podalirius]
MQLCDDAHLLIVHYPNTHATRMGNPVRATTKGGVGPAWSRVCAAKNSTVIGGAASGNDSCGPPRASSGDVAPPPHHPPNPGGADGDRSPRGPLLQRPWLSSVLRGAAGRSGPASSRAGACVRPCRSRCARPRASMHVCVN